MSEMNNYETNAPVAKEAISVGGWIGRTLIPMIPLVGSIVYLIMLFVWSGDKKKEDTFRNWAKAQLIVMAIVIVLTVIGNLPNLSYKIPRLDLVNDIGGTLLGVVTGVLFCMLLVWALKFLGMIIGDDTLTATKLGKLFLEHNIYPKYLGI